MSSYFGMPGNLAPEFRAAHRFPIPSGQLPGQLLIQGDNIRLEAIALNVSSTGLAVICRQYVAAGTLCSLVVDDSDMELKLEVVYANLIPGDHNGYRVGLKCRCRGFSLAKFFRELDLISGSGS